MKKIIHVLGSIWNAILDNAALVLVLLGGSLMVAVIVAQEDNTARPSAEIEDEVWTQWQEMDPFARTMVCNMFENLGNDDDFFEMLLTESGNSEMKAQAKIAVMEQECDRVHEL